MGNSIVQRDPKGHFRDRREAGRALGEKLAELHLLAPLVVALPRGGVPVGYEVAQCLHAPLDLLLVRKLGAPAFPELGIGAVVDGPAALRVLNDRIIEAAQVPADYIEAETHRQRAALEARRDALRRGQPAEPVEGRTVILVDDGIATGGTMRVAVQAMQQAGAARCLVGAPVAPPSAPTLLGIPPSDFVCLLLPVDFESVGRYYQDFTQVSDEEVADLLQRARGQHPPHAPAREAGGAPAARPGL